MSLSQAYASTHTGSTSGLTALFRSVRATIAGAVAEQRALSRARQELNAYSDRQLADLGISRADIPSVVDGSFAR